MDRVQFEIRDHVAQITLSRPDKMNAVDGAMIEAVIAAGTRLAEEAREGRVRAAVLSGAGRAFCAGLDVASFGALAGKDPMEALMPRTHGLANDFQQVALTWRAAPVPVIAALHGPVFGAGLQMALGADIRIAQADARLSVMEMKWGLVPDMGGMVLLPRLVRSDVLRRLTYTAQQIDAAEAARLGLVTEMAEDALAAAQALAAQIAAQSPAAIRAAKALIATAESGAGEAEVLLEESRAQAGLIGGPDQMEIFAAQSAGRPPRFGKG